MQTGSNGFALAPAKTASGNAILYINPHTIFYFRPEIQMSSEEGLNAYGAVTWGNFSYIKDLMKIVDGCTLLLM
jgi:acyl-homoserine lactone acylase PvdQ